MVTKNRVPWDERGAALIAFVFMMLVGASIILVAYGFVVEHEYRSSGSELTEQQALYVAETGVERAMEYLKNDTDWSNNNGTGVISETFATGTYTVDFSSGTAASIVVTSQGAVDSGSRQVTRKIRGKIRRLPEAFQYALFWNGTGTCQVNQGDVDVNGGDVFTKAAISSASPGTIDVAGSGTPSATNGGLVYTTSAWTASGTYTSGVMPGDQPTYPTLDTTYFDNQITTAEGQAAGSLTINTATYTVSGTTYVNGNITVDGTAVSGSGALIATGTIEIKAGASITPDSGASIRLITKTDLFVKNATTTTRTRTLIYTRRDLILDDGADLTGALVVTGTFDIKAGGSVLTGYIHAATIALRDTTTINGSLVVNRFAGNKITNPNKTVTINHDPSYLEDAAPGLGLDIDSDGTDEGVILQVPATWEQL